MQKFLSSVQNGTLKDRADLSIIAGWIKGGSSVLDLGCGDGSLLRYLIDHKDVKGMGVEIDRDRIISCIEKGIPVIEHDLNVRFSELEDRTYDYVILSQTIQEVAHPDILLDEILRIGHYGIVSFPNFGYYRVRFNLLFGGTMPKSRALPFEWYNTPNIHLLTLHDFKKFCKERGINILDTIHIVNNRYRRRLFCPNLFSEGCAVLVSK